MMPIYEADFQNLLKKLDGKYETRFHHIFGSHCLMFHKVVIENFKGACTWHKLYHRMCKIEENNEIEKYYNLMLLELL